MTTNTPQAVDDELTGWIVGRLPEGLYGAAPAVTGDQDEVLIVGQIPDVELPSDATDETRHAARLARVARFRQETREARIRVAQEAERLFGRRVSWGAECAGERVLFTTVGVPVMTRLRLEQRGVLDTLIDAGVARSRSEALAWCVRLVAQHQGEWIAQLRDALTQVEQVRSAGPSL